MKIGINRKYHKTEAPFTQTIFFIGFSVIFIEGIEHYLIGENFFSIHFLIEAILFGILIPLLGIFLLKLATRAEVERDQAVDILEKHLAFNEEIRTSPRYDELLTHIVQFPQKVVLTKHSCLHVYDTRKGKFVWAASDGEETTPRIPAEIMEDVCQTCMLANSWDCTPRLCSIEADPLKKTSKRYMMPLAYANSIIALLHFEMVSEEQLSIAQVHALKGQASNMAMAIESASLRAAYNLWGESRLSERQIIAQELHDTLAQNLAYLRLKLDQFSSQDTLEGIVSIRKDLKQMRDIANKAYDQIRNTILAMRSENTNDLTSEIRSHAKKVSKRAGFTVVFKSNGKPMSLPTYIQRQVNYICREALYNIEKHAKAKQVEILMVWDKKTLTVKILDDGLGFNPSEPNKDSSFGITLMHNLASDIDATVLIRSAYELGTEVTIYLPIQNEQSSMIPGDEKPKVIFPLGNV